MSKSAALSGRLAAPYGRVAYKRVAYKRVVPYWQGIMGQAYGPGIYYCHIGRASVTLA